MNYLYNLNHAEGEEQLFEWEIRTLFGTSPKKKQLTSPLEISPHRSVFIKERLTINYEAASFEALVELVKNQPLTFETFKCLWVKYPNQSLPYRSRLAVMKEICHYIGGEADMTAPKQLLGLTEYEGRWLFGELLPNENSWVSHENKPHSYSNSLSVRVSRALANIVVGHDYSKKIVDPCCGVGTVVLEVLTVGGNIVGNELNPLIAEKARENLVAYGYEPVIKTGDIQDLQGSFDTAIIDLPYGHFNPISPEDQQMIIKEAGRLAKNLFLVTQVDMKQEIEAAGFLAKEQCRVKKANFTRFITLCRLEGSGPL